MKWRPHWVWSVHDTRSSFHAVIAHSTPEVEKSREIIADNSYYEQPGSRSVWKRREKYITNIGMLFTGFPIHWVNDLELHICDLRYISRCYNKPWYVIPLYCAPFEDSYSFTLHIKTQFVSHSEKYSLIPLETPLGRCCTGEKSLFIVRNIKIISKSKLQTFRVKSAVHMVSTRF
jgi:hypothetical protein